MVLYLIEVYNLTTKMQITEGLSLYDTMIMDAKTWEREANWITLKCKTNQKYCRQKEEVRRDRRLQQLSYNC